MMQERFQEVKERLTFLTGTLEQAENYRSREKKQYFILPLFMCPCSWRGWIAEVLLMIAVGGLALLFSSFYSTRSVHLQMIHLQEEIRQMEEKGRGV